MNPTDTKEQNNKKNIMSTQRETYILELIDKGMSRGIKQVTDDVNRLRESVEKTGAGGGIMKSFGRIASITAVAGGIGYVGKQVLDLGVNMEQTRIAFSTFLGDSAKANTLIDQLNTFANVTPFNNGEIIKSGRLLLSAGIGANDIVKNLKMIGDVSAGANVPITELTAIFQKATNKGKLQAEELNQFAERGIPLLKELGKTFGLIDDNSTDEEIAKAKSEVLKLGSQGVITSEIMNQAFESMTSEGGTFFNLMQKQSESTGGKISTLIGKIQLIGINVGEMILPVVSAFVDFGIALTSNTELLKTIGIVIGLVTAGLVAYKIVTLISTLSTIGLSGAFATLNAVMLANPVGLIVAGVTALVGIVYFAIKYFEEWGALLLNMIPGVGQLINSVVLLYKHWNSIKTAFTEDGMIAGLKRIGIVLLDSLLLPLQQALELASNIPGLGDLAGSGAQKIADLRERLNLNIPKTSTATTDPTVAGSTGSTAGNLGLNLGTTKSGLKSGISEVKAGAPKVFNIQIDSLIKEQNFETVKDVSSMKNIIRDEVSRILFGVVNDVQTS